MVLAIRNNLRFAAKRQHAWTNSERRQLIVERRGQKGYWGFGKASAVGDVVYDQSQNQPTGKGKPGKKGKGKGKGGRGKDHAGWF